MSPSYSMYVKIRNLRVPSLSATDNIHPIRNSQHLLLEYSDWPLCFYTHVSSPAPSHTGYIYVLQIWGLQKYSGFRWYIMLSSYLTLNMLNISKDWLSSYVRIILRITNISCFSLFFTFARRYTTFEQKNNRGGSLNTFGKQKI